jgi:hypothetical protein
MSGRGAARAAAGVLLAVSTLVAGVAHAAPTAGELAATCEEALAGDYRGEAAVMCDWYVAPCGMCGPQGPPPTEWCVPPGMTGAEVAKLVLAELRAGDRARPAHEAVKEILRRRLPCRPED